MSAGVIVGYVLKIVILALLGIELVRTVYQFVRYRRQLRTGEEYNSAEKKGWVTTTGKFTGKMNDAAIITKTGSQKQPCKEYEVEYYVGGEIYRKWYKFYPAPDPLNIEEGISVVVTYCEKKPWMFDIVEIDW